MSLDVACGELGFLDLTFVGLDAVPAPGEERHGTALVRSPGGGATTAIACARLGLSSALASPLGDDPEGDVIREQLAADGVRWTGRTIDRTALTVVLPADGDRAMVTIDPREEVTAQELATGDPAAVVVSLPRLDRAPAGARLYATTGDAEARPGRLPRELEDARAFIVNAREAELLTGTDDAVTAARLLGARVPCAIVTRGADGAVACADGVEAQAPGVPADVVDVTGAGDLFTAAYVWADHHGAPLEERLRWAVLYAARGTEVATAVGGAMTSQDLAAAGEGLGLASPVGQHVNVPGRDR